MRIHWLGTTLLLAACGGNTNDADTGSSTGPGTASTGEPTTGVDDPDRATLVHSFGVRSMTPFAESEPCAQWTLNNEREVYVNTVTLVNDGGYHHSNWLAVPDTKFAGPDGFFDCEERFFTELDAAVSGTMLFAQSTQSREEVQQLPPGVVVKIPPRHKIIAGVHLLNLGLSGSHSTSSSITCCRTSITWATASASTWSAARTTARTSTRSTASTPTRTAAPSTRRWSSPARRACASRAASTTGATRTSAGASVTRRCA